MIAHLVQEDSQSHFGTFASFKDSLAIKIDDLLPAIDSNARLAFTLGRYAHTVNDVATNRKAGRQVAIDVKGMLKMAATKWKSLNALEDIPSSEMFKVMVDALTMYLFPDSPLAYNSNTERKFGLLVDKAEWKYDDKTKDSRLVIPDKGRYEIDPYLVHLLCMTCDVDQVTQSVGTSGDSLEKYFQVVFYLLASVAKNDKLLIKLLSAGYEKYQRSEDEQRQAKPSQAKSKKFSAKTRNESEQFRVGPITKVELEDVQISEEMYITSVFRELPTEYSKFLQNVASGLTSLRHTSSTDVVEGVNSATEKKTDEENDDAKKTDFEYAMEILKNNRFPAASDRCYIACFRSPVKFSFADMFLFIGNTLLLIQAKDLGDDYKGNKVEAYEKERLKMGAKKGEDPNVPIQQVKDLKELWHDATGKEITSVRLCFATSKRNIFSEVCEGMRVNTAQDGVDEANTLADKDVTVYAEPGELPTCTDIFLSAAGISFLKFNPDSELNYVQVTTGPKR